MNRENQWGILLDEFGYASLGIGDHGANARVYTSLVHFLSTEIGKPVYNGTEYLSLMVQCEIKPYTGLFHRHVKNRELVAHDDDWAMTAVCSKYGEHWICERLHNYGAKHCWSYNNLKPGKRTKDTQRLPHQIYVIKKAAGQKPSWFERYCWNAHLVVTNMRWQFKEHTSQTILNWLVCSCIEPDSKFLRNKPWLKIFGTYYGSNSPIHRLYADYHWKFIT